MPAHPDTDAIHAALATVHDPEIHRPITEIGMLKGIEQASAFVLFLSSGVLERPYCQMEIRHALALKKPIVLLHGA